MSRLAAAVGIAAAVTAALTAQDRLRALPTYERYERMARDIPASVRSGAVAARWTGDGRAVEYFRDGRPFRFDIETRVTSEAPPSRDEVRPSGHTEYEAVERGRQFTSALSPNGAYRAEYRERNIYVSAADGSHRIPITEAGTAGRVKYGTASWVYGEEFEQRTAMWWSPDSRKLAYYRFDEQQVPDFYLTLNQTRRLTTLDTEAYPLAGAANPIVDLFVYDVATKRTTKIDVRDGKPFDDTVVGHYVYRVQWTADARDLIFLRTNRQQNIMEVVAADPDTGKCRVLVREEWPTGWVNNDPRLVFLEDGERFVWESQRTGWNNFYLYKRDGTFLNAITANTTFEAATLVKIDEAANIVFYMAHDGDNAMKLQLHRVGLDGANDVRLTDPAYYHTVGACIEGLRTRIGEPVLPAPCGVSADNRYFVDIFQTHDTPAATRIVDIETKQPIATLATGDASKLESLGLRKTELFSFMAADGATPLHGLLQFPSGFDPARKYPVLVSVYGGPEFTSNTATETFTMPSAIAELGFLVAYVDTRAIPGIGKRTLDAIYQKLGQADVDDLAAGVRALGTRPYVDGARVGIFGTSYGGFVSLLALLRYPDVFAAAAVSSPATDWRNYDTVYTERYMGMPQDNAAGYDSATAMKYVKDLRGRLLLYYGTADNNVHPTHSLQLIKALQEAGKSFDLQVGPDRGHSGMNQERMLEFFVDALKP